MENNQRHYSLDELCALVELPKRTVRYYIQRGLVAPPEGETRGARYDERHLEALLAIKKWQRAGLSLERIQELLTESPQAEPPPLRRRGAGSVEVWSHLVVSNGVELHVEPSQAGLKPEQVRELFRRVMRQFEDLTNEDKNGT